MIGNIIRSLRVKRELSQEALASQLKVDRSTLSKWERGAVTPSIKTVCKMARFFNCPVDYLLAEFLSTKMAGCHCCGKKDNLSNVYFGNLTYTVCPTCKVRVSRAIWGLKQKKSPTGVAAPSERNTK